MKCLLKTVLFSTFLIFRGGVLFGQAPDTAWTKTFGGTEYDEGKSVQQTTDGGYIITGFIYSNYQFDVYLIKTDSLGDSLWTRTYGGMNSDYGLSVRQTSDGGYIIAGIVGIISLPSHDDAYLIKTDSLGDTLWTRNYGGPSVDFARCVQQTTDEGYIFVGRSRPSYGEEDDIYLVKTDSLGDVLWMKTYGGSPSDHGYCVQQTTDGGYIVGGFSWSTDEECWKNYLIKTDSLGDSLWAKIYGRAYDDDDSGIYLQQTKDNGYIIVGQDSEGADYDLYLIKTDSLGDTLWTRTYGGTELEVGHSIQLTKDGGYIIAGRTDSYGAGGSDVYLIKTDSLGDSLWTKTIGGADYDFGYSVQQTTDGGYIVTGFTYSYGPGRSDVYLIKIKPEESGIEEDITPGLFSLYPASPNPFTSETIVRYEMTKEDYIDIFICNMLGQKVRNLYSGKQSSGTHSVIWNGTGDVGEKLSSGIYFFSIKAGDKEASTKVTFVR